MFFDLHLEAGYNISLYFGAMVGKLICCGCDRGEGNTRALRELEEMGLEGVFATAEFQAPILDSPEFRSGDFNTGYITELMSEWRSRRSRYAHQPHHGLHRREQQAVTPRYRQSSGPAAHHTGNILWLGQGKLTCSSDLGRIKS